MGTLGLRALGCDALVYFVADATPFAAFLMIDATASGCDT
jgi:hypothetical protein